MSERTVTGTAEPEQRFAFGENWRRFLAMVDDDRIREAERSLEEMLGAEALRGKTFLDAGSGSGLFSLAAVRLGAAQVHSFDFDTESVACGHELKRRYAPGAEHWRIEQGSVLDEAYLRALGEWDVAYSWGVLHHTGDMWRALDNVVQTVRRGGTLFISIYNNQGAWSRRWRAVKRFYNRGPAARLAVIAAFVPMMVVRWALVDAMLARKSPIDRYREYRRSRGMSQLHDMIDWLGGYPFEVAKPEQVLEFLRARGLVLERLTTQAGGSGCNEYVFTKAT